MKKIAFIFLLGLMCFQTAKAQQTVSSKDTLSYYMAEGHLARKENATYILVIMPYDTTTKLYPVFTFNLNGKKQLVTNSTNNNYEALKFEGVCMDYYPNGHRKSMGNFHDGKSVGDAIEYYPNGKLYTLCTYDKNNKYRLVECDDSTGHKIAENGNGKWIDLDQNRKNIVSQGTVKDSLKDGEWQALDSNKVTSVALYKQGSFVSGTYFDAKGKQHHYTDFEVEPKYGNGAGDFVNFISSHLVYPADARKNNIQGKVIVTFVVERDGTVSNVKCLRGPSADLMDEAIRVVKLSSPWTPGIQDGQPVKVAYTLPINFSF
jgi:TonB family protein